MGLEREEGVEGVVGEEWILMNYLRVGMLERRVSLDLVAILWVRLISGRNIPK